MYVGCVYPCCAAGNVTVFVLIFVTCPFVSRVTLSIAVNVSPYVGDTVEVVSVDFEIVGCSVKNVNPFAAAIFPFPSSVIDVTAFPDPLRMTDVIWSVNTAFAGTLFAIV